MIGNKTGNLGERIAERFLKKLDFTLVDRNYNKKWGEIDLIGEKASVTHFIEVKSVSRESDVFHETPQIRPEDNLHPDKLKRLSRAIQTYIMEKKIDKWQFDVLIVYIYKSTKKAEVKFLENIIIGS